MKIQTASGIIWLHLRSSWSHVIGLHVRRLPKMTCSYNSYPLQGVLNMSQSSSWGPDTKQGISLVNLVSRSLTGIGLTSQLGWRLLETWGNGLKLGFPEDARHTPYSFWGQTIAIRYHQVYIFEHVWTQGMILGRFQGNWLALVPIGGATFDTGKLKMFPKFTGPYFVKTNFYTHTANTIR
jgi:hypothetical protein